MKNKIISLILFFILFSSIVKADPPNWQPLQNPLYSMVLIAQITFNGQLFEAINNNMAGAFGPEGESDCRGIAIWEDSGNFWYFDIASNENGEEINFKIYDDSTDVIYDCNETIIFEDGTTIGSSFDPYILTSPTSVDFHNHNLTFNLNQNTPNPFYKTTYISYSLPKSCNIKIQIYNVKGRLVTTLIDEYKPAGYHSVDWNVKDMSSGIYFYKLYSDIFTSTKMCLILK